MDAIREMTIPRDKGSPVLELPLEREGPADFFPAVCLQSHWDPTMILKRTLPEGYVAQSTDPRPWTRICMEYTTAGEQDDAPAIDPNIVMPSGGQFYPVSRYVAAINDESKLRVLDRPLGTCELDQWEPSPSSDMYDARVLVPKRKTTGSSRIEELAYPKALLRSGPYDCRSQNDSYNVQTSSDHLFNNATKQDRYKAMNKPTKASPGLAPLKAAPEKLRPDLLLNAGPPRPSGASPIAVVAGSRNGNELVLQGKDGSTGQTYNYRESDLASMMAKNEQNRAGSAGLPWIPPPVDVNPNRSYDRAAQNQRGELLANAVSPMVTNPISDDSRFAPF